MSAALAGFALLAGMLISGALVTAPAALAYQGCNSNSSGSANPTVADANQPIDFTVTVRDCNGNGVADAAVSFSQQSGPAGCTASFNPASAKTDSHGVAHTSVSLPAGCPCQYVLSAAAAGGTVTTTVRENGCLPFTAGMATATQSGVSFPLAAALAILGLALIVGGVSAGLAFRRFV